MPITRVFAIDLERSGQSNLFHFTTQVGICCINPTLYDAENPQKCIISTFSEFLPQPENTSWEPRCVEHFWEKNNDLYIKNKIGVATAEYDVPRRLIAWIDEHKDPNAENNLLITDNSAFDFVSFDAIINKHRSLLYLFGDYEQTPVDVTSYYLGVMQRDIISSNTWGTSKAYKSAPNFKQMLQLTPHDAGSDATLIALAFAHVSSNIARIAARCDQGAALDPLCD